MLKWKDRKYVNPRKKVFKNLDTNEILNLELQDDPDNIVEESETPLTAHNLNLAQAELVDDIGTQTQSEREVLTLQQAIQENTEYEIPVEYEVGNNSLEIYYQGTKLIKDVEYLEVGTEGTFSNKIKFHNWGQNVPVGRTIEFIVRGTILTKAITSEETKTQIEIIKAEQEEQNDNIETNKNEIEALRQENALLRSQIPQGSAEGEYITLKDSSNLPFDEFKIEGNSEQATRDGRNYFDASKINNANVQVLDNGKTIKMPIATSGNGYTTTQKALKGLCPNLKVGDIVTLRFNRNLGYTHNNCIYLQGNINAAWRVNEEKTITQEMLNDTVIMYGNSYNNGETEQVILTDFSIMKSTETDTTWEPYGVMPSTKFPSDIRNCGDDVNLFNSNFNDYSRPADYRIYPINLEKNHIYTMDAELINEKIENSVVGIVKHGEKYSDFKMELLSCIDSLGNTHIRTFKIDETWTEPKLVIYAQDEENFNNIFENYRIKLQKGTKIESWSPYNCGTINIKKSNKNFFDANIESVLNNGTNCNVENNKIIATNTAVSNFAYSTIPIPDSDILLGKKVTLSSKEFKPSANNKGAIILYGIDNNNKPVFNFGTVGTTYKLTVNIPNVYPTNVTKLALLVYSNYNGTVKVGDYVEYNDVQIEIGEVATDYIKHQGQTTTVYTQKPFRKVDNTRDTFIKTGNKWYERHYIKRLVLDGTEAWNWGDTHKYNLTVSNIKSQNALCNFFKYKQYTSDEGTPTGTFSISSTKTIIGFVKKDASSLSEFKAFLAEKYAQGIPVYIDYILANPEDIECTQEQTNQLNELLNSGTYKNVTNICSLDEIKPTFEVKYRKDLETLIGGVANE